MRFFSGDFLPPAGMSPTSFELNNLELFKEKEEDYASDMLDKQCELQRRLSLPRPVQELMDAEGSSDECSLRYTTLHNIRVI